MEAAVCVENPRQSVQRRLRPIQTHQILALSLLVQHSPKRPATCLTNVCTSSGQSLKTAALQPQRDEEASFWSGRVFHEQNKMKYGE